MLEMKMTTDLQTELPAEIGFNFEELKSALTEQLHYYNTLVVTEDAIRDAKTDRANLRKLRDAIETRRKEVKRECEKPYKAFEARVKELTALIDAPIMAIDGQVKAFEEMEREKKRGEIAAAYDELIPEEYHSIIPLDRIFDPKWLNKGTTMDSVREALEILAKRTRVDVSFLGAMTDPKHLTAVKAEYIRTLNLDKAMEYRIKLEEAEQVFPQRDDQRAMSQHKEEEKPTVDVQEPVVEAPKREHEEQIYLLRLEIQLSRTQASALKNFLVQNNISHRKI